MTIIISFYFLDLVNPLSQRARYYVFCVVLGPSEKRPGPNQRKCHQLSLPILLKFIEVAYNSSPKSRLSSSSLVQAQAAQSTVVVGV